MGLNDPQWGRKKGNSGPPDLDELWRNVNKKLNNLLKRKSSGGGGEGSGGGEKPAGGKPLHFRGGIGLVREGRRRAGAAPSGGVRPCSYGGKECFAPSDGDEDGYERECGEISSERARD